VGAAPERAGLSAPAGRRHSALVTRRVTSRGRDDHLHATSCHDGSGFAPPSCASPTCSPTHEHQSGGLADPTVALTWSGLCRGAHWPTNHAHGRRLPKRRDGLARSPRVAATPTTAGRTRRAFLAAAPMRRSADLDQFVQRWRASRTDCSWNRRNATSGHNGDSGPVFGLVAVGNLESPPSGGDGSVAL
jgi:hypothetical protein